MRLKFKPARRGTHKSALMGLQIGGADVARAIRSVFQSAGRAAAEQRLKEILAQYALSAPRLAD